ncbi:MAG: PAS domain S-box protein, partial [Thermodesulfobacteriota bacterium]|nr:PAS domain S-box protein [Thermodesulfobacteriota bacterium]
MTRTPKVLVVDDEEGIRFSLRKFLEDDGFNVDVASSFDVAEAAFSDKNYEVAVIDRILSGGHNGVDLVRFIHEHQPDCQTILISAYPTFESAAETLRLKTSAYLTKPICREDIIGAVREAVRRSKIKKESGHNKFLFNSLVEYSPYAIVVYDMSGRVVAVNPAYTHLFGFREGETIGRRVSFLPEMSLEEMDALFAEFIWGETMRVWETKTTTPDGKTLDLSVTLLQIRDNQGELIYIIAGLFDNTKIKRTEKEYRHIQRVATIGALAGGIAHDFNNILTPIIGHVEMVYKKTGADSSIGQNLDQVLRACERAKDLIRQITDFSRMSGKERQPIELSLIVKEVLNLIRASIPATIDIRANIAATKTAVLADPAQIHEVLINLCTNAAQAMNETGGVLEVTLTEADIDSGVSS